MIPLRITNQSIVVESNWKDCEREIERLWEENFFITDFDYGDGVYYVVMSLGTGWTDQYIEGGREFPERHIEDGWNEGYSVTNIALDDEEWIVVLTAGTKLIDQSWESTEDFESFQDLFYEITYEGQTLTKMAYDEEDGLYVALIDDNLGWEQELCNWEDIPADTYIGGQRHQFRRRSYRRSRNESHHRPQSSRFNNTNYEQNEDLPMITDIIDHDGEFFFVESFGTPYTAQRIHRRDNWDAVGDMMTECWADGFFVTSVAHVYDEWVLVFSRM